MTRTGSEAIHWALSQNSWHPSGMCQQFVRSCFGVGSFYPSAVSAWNNAKKRHHESNGSGIPAGVPVFWTGGSRGFGHVAFSLGNGLCRSTDWPSSTRVGTAHIDDISRAWGLHFVGWTEDINTVTIYHGRSLPNIQLDNVIHAARNGIKVGQGTRLKKAVAAEVGKGDMVLNTSTLGPGFREQYKKVQRQYLRTVDGDINEDSVDGIPGRASMTWLGKRRGFDVI